MATTAQLIEECKNKFAEHGKESARLQALLKITPDEHYDARKDITYNIGYCIGARSVLRHIVIELERLTV